MTILPSIGTSIGLQTPTVTATGLVGGFNSAQIVAAELAPYQQPETDLQNQQSTVNANASDYQQISSDVSAMQSAAEAISSQSNWQAVTATSSDPTVATATAADGTPTGSVQFVVENLAASQSLVSSGVVSSTSDVVTNAPDLLVSQGAGQFGLATLASTGLSLGSHTVAITQASEAAQTVGTSDLSAQSSVVVDSSNDQLDITVNGTPTMLTLADSPGGGYSGSQLLSAVQSAISSAGLSGSLQAGYNSTGQLVLATADQGSSQSLQVTGGTALSVLGLSTMSAASTGVDGIVKVDGTATTISDVAAGASVSLAASTGSISATLGTPSQVGASLLQVGSITATDVSTGNGSLASVVANVNSAATGVTASAVATGANSYVLQLASSTTGVNSDLSMDTTAFSTSSLGDMNVASAGVNAQIQVGGDGGYTLSSQNNTFSGLLPGLSVTVLQQSSTPVTVGVAADPSALAAKVQTLVTSANTVLSDIQKYAGYNATTKTAGPLMGSALLQSLTNEVQSIFASTTGVSTLGNSDNVGISLSNGQLSFNSTKFTTAFNANPTAVAALFTAGGSLSASNPSYAGRVSLNYASETTQSGAYDVQISQSAAQATSSGAVLGPGSVSAAETLTFTMSGTSVSYTTSGGQSLSSVAAGINGALASAGLDMSARFLNGNQLQISSDNYGSAASFAVTSTNPVSGSTGLAGPSATAGVPQTFSGVDVAGTINGVAATGAGQFLSAPQGDSTLAGLTLQVGISGISSLTDVGIYDYSPGIAQTLAGVGKAMSTASTGALSQTISNLQSQSTNMSSQIQFYANIVAQQQKLLNTQFSNLEATLGSLQDKGNALSSSLNALTVL